MLPVVLAKLSYVCNLLYESFVSHPLSVSFEEAMHAWCGCLIFEIILIVCVLSVMYWLTDGVRTCFQLIVVGYFFGGWGYTFGGTSYMCAAQFSVNQIFCGIHRIPQMFTQESSMENHWIFTDSSRKFLYNDSSRT